eukprot:Platyproteum_vivax@DN3377_c0_g1_i1.p1
METECLESNKNSSAVHPPSHRRYRRACMPRGPYKKRPLTDEQIKEAINWLKFFSDRQLIKFAQITKIDISKICDEEAIETHLRQLEVGTMRKMWWYTRRVVRSKKVSQDMEEESDKDHSSDPHSAESGSGESGSGGMKRPLRDVSQNEYSPLLQASPMCLSDAETEDSTNIEMEYDEDGDVVVDGASSCSMHTDCSEIHMLLYSPLLGVDVLNLSNIKEHWDPATPPSGALPSTPPTGLTNWRLPPAHQSIHFGLQMNQSSPNLIPVPANHSKSVLRELYVQPQLPSSAPIHNALEKGVPPVFEYEKKSPTRRPMPPSSFTPPWLRHDVY